MDYQPPNEAVPVPPTDAPPPLNPAGDFRSNMLAMTPRLFVTWILIALNVAVFAAMIVKGVSPMEPTTDNLIRWGANFGPRTVTAGEWWRLFTCMFLHIGLIHIAFNMFVLYQIGPFVERLLGNTGFLIVYVVSGLAGAFLSVSWNPYVVSAGASGAIFGLYGALLGFLLLRRDSIPAAVLTPLVKSALVFLGYNLIYGLARTGTDLAAHFGGLVGGFVCGMAMSIPPTVEHLPKRVTRNILVTVASAAVFVFVAGKIPRPVDLEAALKKFGDIETRTLAAYSDALSQVRTKNLPDEQLADLVEKQVLPSWVAEHNTLAGLKHLPERQSQLVSLLVQYMEARQQGWTMLVSALRKHDVDAVKAANIRQASAEVFLKEMASLTK